MVGLSYLPWVKRTQRPPRMSMAGITSTLKCRLAVVRELERDRDVLRVAQGLDHLLERVLVLANDAQLVALDPDLQLVGNVLDPLAQVARELVVDDRIESDVDLAATLAAYAGLVFVQWSWGRLVVRVGSVVEVVHTFLTSPRDQLVEYRLDAGRQGFALQVGDRLLEVVTRSPQLGDDHVQRRGAGGGRVLAPEVGDDAVHAHVAIHNRFSSPHAGEGDPSRSERPDGGFRRAIHFIQWVWKPKPRPR